MRPSRFRRSITTGDLPPHQVLSTTLVGVVAGLPVPFLFEQAGLEPSLLVSAALYFPSVLLGSTAYLTTTMIRRRGKVTVSSEMHLELVKGSRVLQAAQAIRSRLRNPGAADDAVSLLEGVLAQARLVAGELCSTPMDRLTLSRRELEVTVELNKMGRVLSGLRELLAAETRLLQEAPQGSQARASMLEVGAGLEELEAVLRARAVVMRDALRELAAQDLTSFAEHQAPAGPPRPELGGQVERS